MCLYLIYSIYWIYIDSLTKGLGSNGISSLCWGWFCFSISWSYWKTCKAVLFLQPHRTALETGPQQSFFGDVEEQIKLSSWWILSLKICFRIWLTYSLRVTHCVRGSNCHHFSLCCWSTSSLRTQSKTSHSTSRNKWWHCCYFPTVAADPYCTDIFIIGHHHHFIERLPQPHSLFPKGNVGPFKLRLWDEVGK